MSRAPEKIGRLFTLYMRLDLETILITVKNSILLGNTNTFEINSFSYGGVSYPNHLLGTCMRLFKLFRQSVRKIYT